LTKDIFISLGAGNKRNISWWNKSSLLVVY
jgi:hypothetical protein